MKANFRFAILLLALLTSSCNGENVSTSSQVTTQDEPSSMVESINSWIEDLSSEESSVSSEEESEEQTSEYSSDSPMDLYWSGLNNNEFGEAFRLRLKDLINDSGSKTISYSGNNDVLAESDKALNGQGIIPFYHSDQCYTTSWNKEHVWPDSRGAGKSGPGADPQMLRPTASSCNSARGNKFFGTGNNEFDPAVCAHDTKNGDVYPAYEPSRGEAARIIFYVAARYGTDSKMTLSNNPNDDKTKNTMGTLRYLFEWNNTYPVTAQEIRRNNYLHEQGFARNPFIDNRDLVNYIWDAEGLRTTAYEGGSIIDNPDISTSVDYSEPIEVSSEEISFGSSYTFDYATGNWPTQYPKTETSIEDDNHIRFTYYYAARFNNTTTLQFKKEPQGYIYNEDPFDPIDQLVITMEGNVRLTVYAGDESNPSAVIEPNNSGLYDLDGATYIKLVNETGGAVKMQQFELSFAE